MQKVEGRTNRKEIYERTLRKVKGRSSGKIFISNPFKYSYKSLHFWKE